MATYYMFVERDTAKAYFEVPLARAYKFTEAYSRVPHRARTVDVGLTRKVLMDGITEAAARRCSR